MPACGRKDEKVPRYNTMLVVDALHKPNKDFDWVVFQGSQQSIGEFTYYRACRRWEYFVRFLLGTNPPWVYELKPKQDSRNAGQ